MIGFTVPVPVVKSVCAVAGSFVRYPHTGYHPQIHLHDAVHLTVGPYQFFHAAAIDAGPAIEVHQQGFIFSTGFRQCLFVIIVDRLNALYEQHMIRVNAVRNWRWKAAQQA